MLSARTMRNMQLLTTVAATLGGATARAAAQAPVEHPATPTQLRPLTTDRPGNGENPFTVNAGHIQFEFNAFGYTRSGAEAPGDAVLDAGFVKARIGLTSRVEAQLLFNGYLWTRPAAGVVTRTTPGFGARVKLNLVGADDEGFSLGVIPAVAAVHGEDGQWSTAWSLSAAAVRHAPFGLVAALTLSTSIAPTQEGTVASGFAAIGVSRAMGGPIPMMAEFTAIRSDLRVRETEGRLGTAIVAAVTGSTQFDLGIDAAVTSGAAAYRVFFGAVRRF